MLRHNKASQVVASPLHNSCKQAIQASRQASIEQLAEPAQWAAAPLAFSTQQKKLSGCKSCDRPVTTKWPFSASKQKHRRGRNNHARTD